ncbi:TetR/AcrR family transcriptional regulator [Nonomuraea purpurea]|uniref:TetR/AcrR family transcriptional regulator n=1 Tax=Nonomuraea purpurea TaxID=1849276 RepID=A0ABV8G2A3_9ACTN
MASGIGRRRAAALAEGGAAYAERRAEIIAAAAKVFREKGFRGATLADVAASLNTDRATLYYYVGSKEELFHEIVQGAAEANAKQAEDIRDGEGSTVDKLRQLITMLMSSYAEHYPYLFVYIQEDLSRVGDGRSKWERDMKAINKRYDDAVIQIVQAGLDDGTIRPTGPARVIAYGLIGMVNWTHRWYRDNAPGMPSAAEIGGTFAESLLNGLAVER